MSVVPHATAATVAIQPPAAPAVHPLYQRLFDAFGFTRLTAETLDTFLAAPGRTLLVFLDDPERIRESLDLAVIAPEVAAAFPQMRVGVLLAQDAVACAPRFGFRRWPALVVTDGPAYVGAVDGLRDWGDYVTEMAVLVTVPPTRAPTVGIAVVAANPADHHCH